MCHLINIDIVYIDTMPICLNNLKRKTSVSFIFMCVLIMLGCLSSVGQAEEDRKIFVDLFGYGMKTLDVPIAFKNNFQRAKLNQTFLNAEV